MTRPSLRGVLCILAFAASVASAQQYADAATLQMLRANIDQVRQQTAQLRSMGVDAATLSLMDANLRYLELQYSSLAGTGPAPGSPQMVAAERAWLEAQVRNLQVQRQQLAQMGADAGSLAMLDQSIAALRTSIAELGATSSAYAPAPAPAATPGVAGRPAVPPAGPGYRPFDPPLRYTAWGERVTSDDVWIGYNTIGPQGQDCTPEWNDTVNRYLTRAGCPGPGKQNNGAPDWVASYPTVGPQGQDCTPFYNAQLNRWLVPGGCPMPGSSQAPGKPAPSTFTMPSSGGYGLSGQTPTPITPLPKGTSAPAPKPGAAPLATPTPRFEAMPGIVGISSLPPSRPVLSQAPAQGASIQFCGEPNVLYARRPECDPVPAGNATGGGGAAGASGGRSVNWGQLDKRAPSIQTTRSTESKFEQTTVVSRYDITIDACKVKEARVDYKHNGFLGDAQVSGKVTLIGTNGCVPKPNTRLFMRLEQGGKVGWIELRVEWNRDGTGGFSSLNTTSKAVWQLEGLEPVATWDKASAIAFFTDGVVKGFLVVPGK